MPRKQKTVDRKILDNSTPDPKTGCWVWNHKKMLSRYGRPRICQDGKWMIAARAAYEHWIGPIPKDMVACHKCDNGLCVNPNHLFVGTQQENVRDCIQKGRFKWSGFTGTHCPRGHELTPENLIDYTEPNGRTKHRRCRACFNAAQRARTARLSTKKPPMQPPVEIAAKMVGGECKRGHEFTDANTQWRFEKGYWKRACKACRAETAYRAYRAKNGLESDGDPKKRYRYGT